MWRLHRPLTFQRVAKKGDLERLISLKLSSQPQSQPVCSHQPDTGPHQKITQNIYRGIPTEKHRAAGGLFTGTPDLQCANTQRWGWMNGGKKKKKGWYRPGLQLTTRHLLVSARGRCERRWKTALYMKISIRGSGCMDHNPGFLSTTEQRSHLSWEKSFAASLPVWRNGAATPSGVRRQTNGCN